MCPEIKHSQSGLEKSSVLGLEALASAPETAFQNFLLQGAVEGGQGTLETVGWARAGFWSIILFSNNMTLTDCKENTPASSYWQSDHAKCIVQKQFLSVCSCVCVPEQMVLMATLPLLPLKLVPHLYPVSHRKAEEKKSPGELGHFQMNLI